MVAWTIVLLIPYPTRDYQTVFNYYFPGLRRHEIKIKQTDYFSEQGPKANILNGKLQWEKVRVYDI